MYMYTSELLLHVTGDPCTYLYSFDVWNNKTLWSVYCHTNVMVAPVGYVFAVCINVGIENGLVFLRHREGFNYKRHEVVSDEILDLVSETNDFVHDHFITVAKLWNLKIIIIIIRMTGSSHAFLPALRLSLFVPLSS